MNAAHCFLVSTPLHLMVSIAIADTEKLDNVHLIFIDQVKSAEDNPYYQLAKELQLFKSLHIFMRPPRAFWHKRRHRKTTFAALKTLIESIRPEHIYCGNDRRVEFQYAMFCAANLALRPHGYYMDEGTFTYVGRQASDSFSDKIVDNTIKKLGYGLWWQHPPTVGASSWVNSVYISFPALAHPLLQKKDVRELSLLYWQSPALKRFCELLLSNMQKPTLLEKYDLFYTFPHESVMQANPNYKTLLQQSLQEQLRLGKTIGVKYHPRDTQQDVLGVGNLAGVEVVDRKIPFEALLPLFQAHLTVVGDFSTTLITTRLLRPDLAVTAINHGASVQSTLFVELYEKLGITVITV